MRGARGGRLRRRRALARSFAHLYETGAMRRTHLRGHANILKRLLIHGSGFNLGLAMRHCLGMTPRRGAARGRHDRLSCPVGTHCAIGGGGEPQSADHSLRVLESPFPTIASGAASAVGLATGC